MCYFYMLVVGQGLRALTELTKQKVNFVILPAGCRISSTKNSHGFASLAFGLLFVVTFARGCSAGVWASKPAWP